MITSPPAPPSPSAPAPPRPTLIGPGTLREMVDAYERNVILIALSVTGGHQRRAAQLLGLLPSTLNEKMRKFRIRSGDQSHLVTGGLSPRTAAPEGEE